VPSVELKDIYNEYTFYYGYEKTKISEHEYGTSFQDFLGLYGDHDVPSIGYSAFCRHIKSEWTNVTFHKAKTVALKCGTCAEFLTPSKGEIIGKKDKAHIAYLQACHRSM
jgi:hypothetical protein